MVSLRFSGRKSGGRRFLLSALALLAAVGAGAASPAMAEDEGVSATLRTLNGLEVRVSKEGDRVRLPGIQARAVLVNFWATWCDPCREEIPDLVSLFEKYRSQGVAVVGISFDTSLEKVTKFVRDYRVPYPIWIGSKTLVRAWMVRGLPATYLVSGDGVIRKVYMGARKKETFEKDLLEVLSPPRRDGEEKK